MIHLATCSLTSGVVLGVAARRARRRRVPRRAHQAAFASSIVFLCATTVTGWRHDRKVSVADGAALILLATLPQHPGWSRRHVGTALGAVALHLVAVAEHLRAHRSTPSVRPESVV